MSTKLTKSSMTVPALIFLGQRMTSGTRAPLS